MIFRERPTAASGGVDFDHATESREAGGHVVASPRMPERHEKPKREGDRNSVSLTFFIGLVNPFQRALDVGETAVLHTLAAGQRLRWSAGMVDAIQAREHAKSWGLLVFAAKLLIFGWGRSYAEVRVAAETRG
jgi:hypothetical protein